MAPRRRLVLVAAGQFRRGPGSARRPDRSRQDDLLLRPGALGDGAHSLLRGILFSAGSGQLMSRIDELRRIADSIGIAARHVDALGVVHEPDEETLAQLIAAFGLPPDPKQTGDALAGESRNAPFVLPPVHIVAHETPDPVLPLRATPPGARIEWQCRLED